MMDITEAHKQAVREVVERMTAGHRAYHMLNRLHLNKKAFKGWENEHPSVRNAYEEVVQRNPVLAPSPEEVVEREIEMLVLQSAISARPCVQS